MIPESSKVILVINKVDQLVDHFRLPFIDQVRQAREFAEIAVRCRRRGATSTR